MIDALLIIESDIKGGSMITAKIANSYQKDVLAIPGNIGETYSSGCNYLIKSHLATLVENTADLEKMMNWDLQKRKKEVQIPLFTDLTPQEEKIIGLLKHYRTLGIDELSYRTNMKMSEISATLLNLEFKFAILSLPGKRYSIAQ
jgi:DNA processing protein